MTLRIGSLFTGTGALDLAVMDVYGAEVIWHSQYEPPDKKGKEDTNQYAAKILARHWPTVPNLGDVTRVNFTDVRAKYGRVEILTAGFPCQPFSIAGRRLGYQDERWLWDDVARAVRDLRPQLVLLENVPGLFTAPGRQPDCVCGWSLRWGRQLGHRLADDERTYQVLANDDRADGEAARIERPLGDAGRPSRTSDPAESRTRLRGDAPLGSVREHGEVSAAGDVAVLAGEEGSGGPSAEDAWPRVAGFDEWAWHLLDAERFGGVAGGEGPDPVAEPAGDGGHGRLDCPACGRSMDDAESRPVRRAVGDVLGSLSHLRFDAEWINLRASEVGAPHQRKRVFIRAWPAHADPANLGHERAGAARNRGTGSEDRGVSAAHTSGPGLEVGRVQPDGTELPTAERSRRESVADADRGGQREDVLDLRPGQPDLDWGDYEPAIRRWERILGRPAPWPTDVLGRLSPVFTEWLMGLPDGWVTDTPGLTRAAMLRALGNGVVRQQAAYALRVLHERVAEPELAAA